MITTKVGDVTKANEPGLKVLCHIVNNVNMWGSGVVIAISNKWPHVKKEYSKWFNYTFFGDKFYSNVYCSLLKYELGEVQFVEAEQDWIVANMMAQKTSFYIGNKEFIPLRYEALEECMYRVAEFCKQNNARIVCPEFGSLRAGGDWNRILQMIKDIWDKEYGLDITIYKYKE